jgi:tetratricopeptide (TPR) repeat protein
MLVVRKQGGRNINNDRYIYINVDDNPQPFPELRRLLDMNLGLLYQDRTFKLLRSGKTQDARDAAAQAAHYFPDRSDMHLNLGMLNYAVGDKKSALTAFRAAQALDKNFRKQFDAAAARPANKAILEDTVFLKELFPE